MNKYNNSKIYTIRSPNTDKFYIGSTTQKLCQRFTQHKCNDGTNSKIIIDSGDAYIELLESFSCNNREELNKREGELIRLNKDYCVNKFLILTPKEQGQKYYLKNIDKFKNYYENNIDEIKTKRKEKITCECGAIIQKTEIARHKKSLKHLSII